MTESLSEDEALAAEYMLGVLDIADRMKVEARLKSDPAFVDLVNAWQNRFVELNDAFSEATAPNLLPRIEAQLFPAPVKPARSWFGWFAGAAALAAVLIFFALPQPQAPLLATIAGDALSYEARYDGAALTISRVAGTPAPAGTVHQLWIIAPGSAPVSLGLLADADLTVTTKAPKGWTLAVSLEPAGGAPDGVPTGPILAAVEIGT